MVKTNCKEIRFTTKLQGNYNNIVIYQCVMCHCTHFSVHIRRMDKIGSFHKLEEYMYYVEEYYKLEEMNGKTLFKAIYLATDDPTLFEEAYKKRVKVKLVLYLILIYYNSSVF